MERGNERAWIGGVGGWDGGSAAATNGAKTKNREEGTRSGSLCLWIPEKKGSREQPEEEERKEKLRVDVEGGQLAVRPPRKVRRDGEEAVRLRRGER